MRYVYVKILITNRLKAKIDHPLKLSHEESAIPVSLYFYNAPCWSLMTNHYTQRFMNCPKSYRQRLCGTRMITTIQNTIGIV